jgi:hypothetical protein
MAGVLRGGPTVLFGQHDADAATVRNGVHDGGLVQEPCLPGARRLIGRRIGQPHTAGSDTADVLRRSLSQHLSLMQDDDVAAALRLIEIGRGEQHGQALFVHERLNDFPQLPARQRIDTDGRFVEQ